MLYDVHIQFIHFLVDCVSHTSLMLTSLTWQLNGWNNLSVMILSTLVQCCNHMRLNYLDPMIDPAHIRYTPPSLHKSLQTQSPHVITMDSLTLCNMQIFKAWSKFEQAECCNHLSWQQWIWRSTLPIPAHHMSKTQPFEDSGTAEYHICIYHICIYPQGKACKLPGGKIVLCWQWYYHQKLIISFT